MLTLIRQLEFTLLQLTYQFDNLFDAIQCTIHGKFSIILTDLVILQTVFRNVTLQLPEGYQLIVNSKTENIHLFYELAKVSLGANIHGIKLLCVCQVHLTVHLTHTHTDGTDIRPQTAQFYSECKSTNPSLVTWRVAVYEPPEDGFMRDRNM